MKKIILIVFAASIGILYSCNKSFLDKTDPTRIDVNKFYSNEDEIERALNGIYGQLQVIINDQWLFNELPSDNTTIDFNPNDRGQASDREQYEYWQITTANPHIIDMYNNYYNAIFNINNTLKKLASSVGISDEESSVVQGQLKFLRAYYYFNLSQYLGDAVIITEPLSQPSDAFNFIREPQSKVYDLVESDLKDAINLLPTSYSPSETGKVTKGAALTMLGEFYLTKKQFGDAVNTLGQVMNLGYDLLPSYADVFDPKNKNSVESIFEIQYQGGNDLGEWSNFIYVFAPRDSKGFITGWPQSQPGGWGIPTNDLISTYETGDLRKDASIGLDYHSPVTGQIVPYIKKYAHPHAIYGRTDDDWYVFRYADVLLMLAEAINEQSGPSSEAYSYLNKVRNRAGLSSLSGLDQAGFRSAVYHERRVELAFENDRWFFLKRTMAPNELVSFLNNYGNEERANPTVTRQGIPFSNGDYIITEGELLYPISSDQIRINNKITQNPGY